MIEITETHGESNNFYATYGIVIKQDGKILIDVDARPCEPEDAILERDLGYVYDIITAFKLGYEAGKNKIDVKYEKLKEE